jgi:mRNA interferase RelE/StbE
VSYTVFLSARAQSELKALHREIVKRLDQHIAELSNNPRPPGCKKLRSKTPEGWRIRVGAYRILYQIDDQAKRVLIHRIGHRRNVYE